MLLSNAAVLMHVTIRVQMKRSAAGKAGLKPKDSPDDDYLRGLFLNVSIRSENSLVQVGQ